MRASTKSRIDKIERLIAPTSGPPSHGFAIIDLATFPDHARVAYNEAAERGDWRACNLLMERYAGIPAPPESSRRRRLSRRPLRVVELVIDHMDESEPEPIDDAPDTHQRVMKDGSAIIVTSPQNPPPLDPEEIVGHDPFGYAETRAQHSERLRRAASSYQSFDSGGRPL